MKSTFHEEVAAWSSRLKERLDRFLKKLFLEEKAN